MIAKYERQAIDSVKWFAVSFGVFIVCIILAMAIDKIGIGIGIFLALCFVAAGISMLIFYFLGFFYFAKAKGYSEGMSLLGVILFFLDDVSNPAKEAEEEKYQGPRCVCCNIRISPMLKICPKCNWTQPVADIPEVAQAQ